MCILAHLSEENNRPELALDAARNVLAGKCRKVMTGMQDRALPAIDLEE